MVKGINGIGTINEKKIIERLSRTTKNWKVEIHRRAYWRNLKEK